MKLHFTLYHCTVMLCRLCRCLVVSLWPTMGGGQDSKAWGSPSKFAEKQSLGSSTIAIPSVYLPLGTDSSHVATHSEFRTVNYLWFSEVGSTSAYLRASWSMGVTPAAWGLSKQAWAARRRDMLLCIQEV